jgi:hypothetical protein
MRHSTSHIITVALWVAIISVIARAEEPYPLPKDWAYSNLPSQTHDDALMKSHGCMSCHTDVGDMHSSPTVHLGCTDCHGGNAGGQTMEAAHVAPRFPNAWRSSGNPIRSYTLLNHESPEFVRFVNPGDLRIAHIACGQCHEREVLAVRKSMMTHGCMLWGAALYNNGAYPKKWAGYGESYSMCGTPQRMITVPPPSKTSISAVYDRTWTPCPASKSHSPATSCASSNAAVVFAPRQEYRNDWRNQAVRGND